MAHDAVDMPTSVTATGLAFAAVLRSVVFLIALNVVPANVTAELFVWMTKAAAAWAVSLPAKEIDFTIPTDGSERLPEVWCGVFLPLGYF